MDWQLLSAQLLNGLVLGSIYALIALGYTMVGISWNSSISPMVKSTWWELSSL